MRVILAHSPPIIVHGPAGPIMPSPGYGLGAHGEKGHRNGKAPPAPTAAPEPVNFPVVGPWHRPDPTIIGKLAGVGVHATADGLLCDHHVRIEGATSPDAAPVTVATINSDKQRGVFGGRYKVMPYVRAVLASAPADASVTVVAELGAYPPPEGTAA